MVKDITTTVYQLEKTKLIDLINQSAQGFTTAGDSPYPPYSAGKDTKKFCRFPFFYLFFVDFFFCCNFAATSRFLIGLESLLESIADLSEIDSLFGYYCRIDGSNAINSIFFR